VPEIHAAAAKGKKLIANPNCTTAIGLMALWPLHLAFGLKKVIMATYQAASGAGQEGKCGGSKRPPCRSMDCNGR
jgi:aspartate-semialdehyde dehydrogenase